MSIFSDNIRFLRDQKMISQAKIAADLLITRERYAKYEDGSSEPPIEIFLRISKYHKVSIDLLVSIDVRKYPIDDLVKLPDNRIVLPVKVDKKGENVIEIVPHKAQMGYLNGYDDPDYITSLQHMSLPFLRNGKYRAFPAGGDSMPPYDESTYIIGKYIESKNELKPEKTYIFITHSGIIYKRYSDQTRNAATVKSDNDFYQAYEIEWPEVIEIWQYEYSISRADLGLKEAQYEEIKKMLNELQSKISNL